MKKFKKEDPGITLIRKIHLNKLADRVDVSDLTKSKKEENVGKIEKIFKERTCSKCGAIIGRYKFCRNCEEVNKTKGLFKSLLDRSKTKKKTRYETLLLTKVMIDSGKSLFTIHDIFSLSNDFVSEAVLENFIESMINRGILSREDDKITMTHTGFIEFTESKNMLQKPPDCAKRRSHRKIEIIKSNEIKTEEICPKPSQFSNLFR